MEVKFVIIMHNLDNGDYEESPLLPSYPKPDLIEFYLKQSVYSYAKVEKRFAVEKIKEYQKPLYTVHYMMNEWPPETYETHDLYAFNSFVQSLAYDGIPYETEGEEDNYVCI